MLSGAHLSACRRLIEELRRRGIEIPLVLGGVIPKEDHEELRRLGVAAIFGPESPLEEIVRTVSGLGFNGGSDR